MGRKQRVWLPHLFYHVTSRGNRRDPLFRSREDFQAFLHIMNQIYERIPFEVVAFCLMTNHFHLQLRSPHEPLSKLMALINKRYANYYNTKYNLTGHVFEKRYFSHPIEDRKGMLEVSRYIHLNPCEAQIVNYPELYPWSSYEIYKYPITEYLAFINPTILLDLFPGRKIQKQKTYCTYIEHDINNKIDYSTKFGRCLSP